MYAVVKRIFDFSGALLLLILLSPALILLIALLLLNNEREVFYRQQRIGFGKKTFFIWKFATMIKNSPLLGAGTITIRDDPRVTSLGRILRATKLNELPQLLNILMGDMSFVGPRPLMHDSFILYPVLLQEAMASVLPGLTGVGSLFFRDEEAFLSSHKLGPKQCYEVVIMPYKGELETWYLQHLSFKTDFILLLLTFWYIFNPKSQLLFKVFKTLPKQKVIAY
jgi:lipopolysaccharide/colanic/teichoic acid biosynthesis glycosyltransferase